MVQLRCTVFLGDEEWTAHFDYSRGRPACNYQRNGDPGWPADPPEVTVNMLTREGESKVSRTMCAEDDEAMIEQACIDAAIEWETERELAWYESREREKIAEARLDGADLIPRRHGA